MTIPKLPVARLSRPEAPILAEPGPVLNGAPAAMGIDPQARYPDARSHRLKVGLLIPATNTSMEQELWTLLVRNAGSPGLDGIGIHTTNVVTPIPRFGNAEELAAYRDQFLAGLKRALPIASLAEPDHLLLGMSLEHILHGLDAVRAPAEEIRRVGECTVTSWDEASDAALKALNARRIALITPFDNTGNENAARVFADLGYDVVSTFGFSCSLARHVAHVPDWAKERAILEYLAPPGAAVEAVVQCGTNMSMCAIAERLEPVIGIPIVGINAGLLWHMLRSRGINTALSGGGALLRI